jgi:hypothetical protein
VDEEIVTLASFRDPIEALWVKGRLEEAGFRVFQSGDASGGAFAGLGGASDKVQLHVFESDQQRAMAFLTGLEEEEEDEPGEEKPSSTAVTAADGGQEPERETETSFRAVSSPEPRQLAPETGPSGPTAIQTGPLVLQEAPGQADDDDDEDETGDRLRIRWKPDEIARRAFVAAVCGIMLMSGGYVSCLSLPLGILLNVYSVALLGWLMTIDEELSPRGMRRLYGAMAANGVAFLLLFIFLVFPWRIR